VRQINKGAMLPYFANYVSQLCEETVTLGWYRQSLRRRLTGREKTDVTIYMESKLGGIWPENNGEIASRLRIEQNHHDIDIYEALLGALHAIAARKNLDEVLRAATLSACADLASLV